MTSEPITAPSLLLPASLNDEPKDRPQHNPGTHKVWQWNAKVNRPDDVVVKAMGGYIERREPEVILLQEFQKYVSDVAKAFRRDYDMFAATGWPEASMNAIMVRHGHDVGPLHVIRTHKPWRGPVRGLIHHGRTCPAIRVDGIMYQSVHGPTGHRLGQNPAAWREFWQKQRAFFDRLKDRDMPFFSAGDWNLGDGFRGNYSTASLARMSGAKIIPTGAPVDYAIARGVQASGRTGAKYGSDHHSVAYTVRIK